MRFRVGWGGEWHTHYSFLLEKNFITKCSISQLKHNKPGLLRVCVQRLQREKARKLIKFLCTSDTIGGVIPFLFLRKNGYTHNQSDYP